MPISARRLFPLLLLPVLAGAGAPPASDQGPRWRLISDRDGIQVYRPRAAATRAFRGVTRLPDGDEYALVALLEDYAAYPEWMHFVDGARPLNPDQPGPRRLRLTTLMPWPLADRDAVVEARVRQVREAGRQEVVVTLRNRPALLPPDPDYLRLPALTGELRFRRVPPDELEVRYQLSLDPGGGAPDWLIDLLLREAPHFTLERLRRVVTRAEYQGHYYPDLDLRGPGRPASTRNVTKPQ